MQVSTYTFFVFIDFSKAGLNTVVAWLLLKLIRLSIGIVFKRKVVFFFLILLVYEKILKDIAFRLSCGKFSFILKLVSSEIIRFINKKIKYSKQRIGIDFSWCFYYRKIFWRTHFQSLQKNKKSPCLFDNSNQADKKWVKIAPFQG